MPTLLLPHFFRPTGSASTFKFFLNTVYLVYGWSNGFKYFRITRFKLLPKVRAQTKADCQENLKVRVWEVDVKTVEVKRVEVQYWMTGYRT